jgi:hypothetical protein
VRVGIGIIIQTLQIHTSLGLTANPILNPGVGNAESYAPEFMVEINKEGSEPVEGNEPVQSN